MQRLFFLGNSILIALSFFLLAKLGLLLSFVHSNVTLIWLPSGLSVPILLFAGNKYLPAIFIGAFLATFSTGAPLEFAILTAIGNSLEPLASSYVLKIKNTSGNYLSNFKEVILFFIFSVFLAPIISASIGVFGLCAMGMTPWYTFFTIAFDWWAGNAFGVLTLGSFLIILFSKSNIKVTNFRIGELSILSILLILTQTTIYFELIPILISKPLAWTAYPFLIWASVRFHPKVAISMTCLTIFIIVIATIQNKGLFHMAGISESLFLIYGFAAVTILNTLFFIAATSERIIKEGKLAHNTELLERMGSIAKIGGWDIDVSNMQRTWTKEIFEIHELPYSENAPPFSQVIQFYPPEAQATLKSAMQNAIEKGIPYSLELPFITAKGKHLWIHTQCRIVTDKNAKVIKLIGTFQDITSKKIIESQLIYLKDKAEAANRSKSEFLANMSHELRTPLNSVITLTDLLIKSNLSELQNKYLKIVLHSANSLLDLLNNILDYAKLESGKIELKTEKVEFAKLIEQAVNIVKINAQEKKLTVHIEIPDNFPKYIFIDSVRLRQILLNLIINAIKFTEKGNIKIQVSILHFNQSLKRIHFLVSVQDTGIGISIDNQEKILEAFTQVDTSTNRKYKGIGLGLSISNALLKLMNSKLQLESQIEKGSNFHFTLETLFEEEQISTLEKIKKDENVIFNPIESLNNNFKILVVDDDEINIFLVKTILKEILPSAFLFEAINGKEALDVYFKEEPDLIFLDIQMPEMNGLEVTKAIRSSEQNKKTIIIALTAGTMKGDKEKCLEIGMDDYASKPFVKDTIANLINKWLLNKI